MTAYSAPIGTPILVNTLTAADQQEPQAVALAGGGYAVMWHSGDSGIPVTLRGAIFDSSDQIRGTEFEVMDDLQSAQTPFSLIATGGGMTAVEGARSSSPFSLFIEAQGVTGTGVLSGEGEILSTLTSVHRNPDAAALGGGAMVTVWESLAIEGTFATMGIAGRIVGGPGAGETEFLVNTTTDGAQGTPQVAALTGGGFVVVWNGPAGVYAQRFTDGGAPLGGEVRIDTATDRTAAGQVQVAGLAGGGFMAVWTQAVGGDTRIFGQAFDATGAPVGGEIAVSTTTVHEASTPQITALQDGGALIGWSSHGFVGGVHPPGFYLQRVAADGSLQGSETVLFDSGGVSSSDLSLTTLPGNEVLATWTAQLPGGDGLDIYAQHVISAGNIVGTDLADLLLGAYGDDLIRGLAGNDTLRGEDGSDTLIGDAGNDVLIGGATAADLRDVIYGGAGHDSIDGGYGNDELRGDGGNDTIVGGYGADTVIGGDGDDALTGQTWSDAIFGGAGDDFINGGFGHDRVNGGIGADRFYHLGVEGHGSDWVQDFSNAEGDVLVYGGAGASVEDFQVNFTETANAGAAGTAEAFVIFRPTGQILWALVDGGAQDSLIINIAGSEFDLLA